MKRISRLILTFAMLFIVVLTTACESNKPITKTFVLKQDNVTITETITYIKSKDKVLKSKKVTDAKMILKSEEARKKNCNYFKCLFS
jgi:lipoprotein